MSSQREAVLEAIDREIEWRKCEADPAYFIDTYCMMWEKEGGDPIPFALWDCQRDTIAAFESNKQLIVLKTRQLGESWTIDGYALHQSVFKANFHVYIRSIGLKEANEQHNRIKFMYENLPDWMHKKVRLGGKNLKKNDTLSEFTNGSAIHMLAASKRAGHGAAASLVFWDEMARDENAEQGWRGIKPAINGGGRVVLVSTSDGPNNRFARVWRSAEKGENDFHTLFFPWDAHPDRNQEWYDNEKRAWEAEGDLEGFYQAYPSNPSEAFQAANKCPFDVKRLQEMARHIERARRYEYVDDVLVEREGGRIHIFDDTVAGHAYTMGVDPAMGLQRGDFTAMAVVDTDTNRLVCLYRGKLAPEAAAYIVEGIARHYNDAFVGVEVNAGYGKPIVDDLKQSYDNLFTREQRDKPWDAPTFVLGWYTHSGAKQEMVKAIRQEMARPDRPLSVPSEIVVMELSSFEEHENGKVEAPKGEHDDTVIALGIALCIRKTHAPVIIRGFVPDSPWPFE